MKDLKVYYFFAITLPVVILLLVLLTNDSIAFSLALLIFIIYRNIIDTKRLVDKGILKQGDKKYYYPFKTIRYFKELYFN